MQIRIESRHLGDVAVLVPEVFEDSRGFFMETFREDQFRELGLPTKFVQDNHSRSVKGTVRGLHFQWEPPMGKLMRVTLGSAFLVAVDIRKGSPHLGNGLALRRRRKTDDRLGAGGIRARLLRAFRVAEIQYKCTGHLQQQSRIWHLWNDPAIGIEWPVKGSYPLGQRPESPNT